MRACLLVLSTALILIFAGCAAHPSPPRRVYVGEIVQIQDVPGDHYSPTKGEKPLTEILVQIGDTSNTRGFRQLKISLLDLYIPATHGGLHDMVSFVFSNRLPLNERVWFDDLQAYHVVRPTIRSNER